MMDTHARKRMLYLYNHYIVTQPDFDVSSWTDFDWVHYLDTCGEWTMSIEG